MPPEPLPWDRREIVSKERRHDRGSGYETLGGGFGGGGGGGRGLSPSCFTSRLREPYHGSRGFHRASPHRHTPGHYRQGAFYDRPYGEEYRSGERLWMEDEAFRPPPMGRFNGSRNENWREGRGCFRRPPNWGPGEFYPHHPEVPPVTAPRSAAVPVTPPPPLAKPSLKDSDDGVVTTATIVADDGLAPDDRYGTSKRSEQDNSLGPISWKPIKWGRSGSFSSSKTSRSEADAEFADSLGPSGKDSPACSPLTSPQEVEDGALKKKQRLGWGQGLAKYEKQKVEGAEDVPGNSCLAIATSPKGLGLPLSQSPVTPFSITCSASPGVEEKPCTKLDVECIGNGSCHLKESTESRTKLNVDGIGNGSCYLNESSVTGSGSGSVYSEDYSMKLKHFEVNPHGNLSKLISDLLKPETVIPCDPTSLRYTSLSELFRLKEDISKELEKTECDIDRYENELKSLDCIGNYNCCENFSNPPDNRSAGLSGPLTDSPPMLCSLESPPSMMPEHDHCLDNIDADESPDSVIPKFSKSEHVAKVISSGGIYASASSDVLVNVDSFKYEHFFSSSDSSWNCDVNMRSVDHLNKSPHQSTNSHLVQLVLSENKNAARMASNDFCGGPQFDIWGSDFISSLGKNNMHVRRKLGIRRHHQKVKDRILVYKYKSFLHLWKEDLHLLSIRKERSKTNKRVEISVRSSNANTHRSFFQPQFVLPDGNSNLVPTSETVDFVNKLLLDSRVKTFRNNLKMPALFLDFEKRYSRFLTRNGLVEDPISFEMEKANLNPWTQDEKEIFMDKLATLGKDFSKIATFLESKTTADCVEFYYKNHKCGGFSEVKKCLFLRKQWQASSASSYLVASGRKWPRDASSSLDAFDAFGIAYAASAQNNGSSRTQQKFSLWPDSGFHHNELPVPCGRHGGIGSDVGSSQDKVNVAANVLVGISGARPSEAMKSCTTSALSPVERITDSMPSFSQPIEEEPCSNGGCDEFVSSDWTDQERSVFIKALCTYGKDFTRVSGCLTSRSQLQCQIFFSKARKCLGLDALSQGPCNGMTLGSCINGGKSDMDDTCVAEMDSAMCSMQSSSKIDADSTLSAKGSCYTDCIQAGCASSLIEANASGEQYLARELKTAEIENSPDVPPPIFSGNMLSKEEDDNRDYSGVLKEIVDPATICKRSIPYQESEDIIENDEIIKDGGSSSPPNSTSKSPLARNCCGPISKLERDVATKQENIWGTDLGGSELEESILRCQAAGPISEDFQQRNIRGSSTTSGIPQFSSDYVTDGNSSPSGNKVRCPAFLGVCHQVA